MGSTGAVRGAAGAAGPRGGAAAVAAATDEASLLAAVADDPAVTTVRAACRSRFTTPAVVRRALEVAGVDDLVVCGTVRAGHGMDADLADELADVVTGRATLDGGSDVPARRHGGAPGVPLRLALAGCPATSARTWRRLLSGTSGSLRAQVAREVAGRGDLDTDDLLLLARVPSEDVRRLVLDHPGADGTVVLALLGSSSRRVAVAAARHPLVDWDLVKEQPVSSFSAVPALLRGRLRGAPTTALTGPERAAVAAMTAQMGPLPLREAVEVALTALQPSSPVSPATDGRSADAEGEA